VPQDLGVDPGAALPRGTTTKELGGGAKLLMDLESGQEPQGVVVTRGHLVEGLVGKVQDRVAAGVQVRRRTDALGVRRIVGFFHL
jgi:hypothetical protein